MSAAPLIVGGGMAGAALALLLRHHGAGEVVLVESHALAAGEAPDTPSFDARSTALSAGSLAILEQLGLQNAVLENAAGIDTVHVSRRGRLGLARLTAAEQNLPRLGAVVENRWFGHVLLRAVEADPAITLRAPASLTGIRRTSDGYEAMLDDGEELHTPLLIAADGARSRTRDWLGISARHRDIGHDALIANVGLAEPHRGQAFERFLDEGPLALLPLPGERMALVWTGPRDDVDRWMDLDDNAFLAARPCGTPAADCPARTARPRYAAPHPRRRARPLPAGAQRSLRPGGAVRGGGRQRRPHPAPGGRPGLQPDAARPRTAGPPRRRRRPAGPPGPA